MFWRRETALFQVIEGEVWTAIRAADGVVYRMKLDDLLDKNSEQFAKLMEIKQD